MSGFDPSTLMSVSHFGWHSRFLDAEVAALADNTLIRCVPPIALLWWAWFKKGEQHRNRELLISGTVLSYAALLSIGIVRLWLPYRGNEHWSWNPGDHASLYWAMATLLWLVSRRLGLLAYCHAILFISLPRLYLGVGYPSDALIGLLLGIVVVSLARLERVRSPVASLPLNWLQASPSTFYGCLYFASLLFSTNFEAVRGAAQLTHSLLQGQPVLSTVSPAPDDSASIEVPRGSHR